MGTKTTALGLTLTRVTNDGKLTGLIAPWGESASVRRALKDALNEAATPDDVRKVVEATTGQVEKLSVDPVLGSERRLKQDLLSGLHELGEVRIRELAREEALRSVTVGGPKTAQLLRTLTRVTQDEMLTGLIAVWGEKASVRRALEGALTEANSSAEVKKLVDLTTNLISPLQVDRTLGSEVRLKQGLLDDVQKLGDERVRQLEVKAELQAAKLRGASDKANVEIASAQVKSASSRRVATKLGWDDEG